LRKAYSSDITRNQFEEIKKQLENSTKATHPMDYDLYDIFCAILYLLKEGCRWRSLPHDFPDWNSVYYHFKKWSKKREDGTSILDDILKKLVQSQRIADNRDPKTTMTIVDSKSVKNADTAEEKGYDGGKKNIRN
jgi:hypothetical protein